MWIVASKLLKLSIIWPII